MSYKYEISHNRIKLLITAIGIIILIFSSLISLNIYLFDFSWWIPILVGCIPVFTMIVSLILNGAPFNLNKLFTLKYSSFCPVIIYFDSKSDASGVRDNHEKKMKEILQPGDIILSREKNHLHGLILGQTSYFTHMGLYYGNWQSKKFQVMHAVGHWGVSCTDLADFCKCADIAVLKFEADPIIMKKHLNRVNYTSIDFVNDKKKKLANFDVIRLNNSNPKTDTSKTEIGQTKDVRTFIEKKADASDEVKELSRQELMIYDRLIENTKDTLVNYVPDAGSYIPLVLKQAALLKGTRYDYNFNFVDFDTLSCVEYVWYCYKCLFPLHQIRRKPFLYFGWIKPFVIIPDMYVANDFFSLQYSSLPNVQEKSQLKRYTRSNLVKFRTFIVRVIVWDIMILLLIYIICEVLRQF